MYYQDIVWYKNLLGGSTETYEATVGATAVKKGDILIAGASAEVVIPMIAADTVVYGVATHDAAVGAKVLYWPAFPWNAFAIKNDGTKSYVSTSDYFTECDMVDFTSGDMRLDCATHTAADFLILGLCDGETDSEAENVVFGVFTETFWSREWKN